MKRPNFCAFGARNRPPNEDCDWIDLGLVEKFAGSVGGMGEWGATGSYAVRVTGRRFTFRTTGRNLMGYTHRTGEEMPSSGQTVESVDEYIESFPEDVQEKLEELGRIINEVAPDAEETIRYRMPTFEL